MKWILCFSSLFSASLAFAVQAPRQTVGQIKKEIDLKAELTGKNFNLMNDDQLYTEILSFYQRGDTPSMKRALNVLTKKYKNSPHVDNALFIVGYNALEKNQFAEALSYFQQLLKQYPTSNKAVSAEFAKGVAYRNMKLTSLAQKSFLDVRKKYPGSPESYRAENELKLLVRK